MSSAGAPVGNTNSLRHGHYRARHASKTWSAWSGMRQRCYLPSTINFANYGGRGIAVCDRWLTFENFLADMGECPPGMSLDRINNDGNYEPGNCRWATRGQQANNRRTNRRIVVGGVSKTVAEWAHETGIRQQTLYWRVRNGWPDERCLLPPE